MSESEPRVVVLDRPGCHLCEDVMDVVTRVCADLDVTWRVISVDDHAHLLAKYGDMVPVTFVDGRQHDFYRVDEGRLRGALTAPTPVV